MREIPQLFILTDFKLSAQQILEIRIENGQASAEFRNTLSGPDNAAFVDDVATGTGCEENFMKPTAFLPL